MSRSQKVAKPYSPLATGLARLGAVEVALFSNWISGVLPSHNSTQHFGSECNHDNYELVQADSHFCGAIHPNLPSRPMTRCSLVSWSRRMTWRRMIGWCNKHNDLYKGICTEANQNHRVLLLPVPTFFTSDRGIRTANLACCFILLTFLVILAISRFYLKRVSVYGFLAGRENSDIFDV
jgi:hypothetical protein